MRHRHRPGLPRALAAAACFGLLASAAPASAAPGIHAHRGGPVINGVPRYPENTMPAFRHAAIVERAVLELDVKLTEDGVPVVIHDDSLDRTTNCSGELRDFTLAELSACRADVLGSPGSGLPTAPAERPVPIPTLAEVLRFARRNCSRLNLEIKNVPTDSDFDPSPAYANRVIDVVVESGIPIDRVLFQNFLPETLDIVKARLPDARTSLLTLHGANDGAPSTAAARGYDIVSPGFPIDRTYVLRAHRLGLGVVPYTLDRPSEVRTAAAIGVDALITDDPAMARRALGLRRPAKRRIRLRVSPRRARVGRRTRFTFKATARSLCGTRRPVSGATVRFAGRVARTNRRGRAVIVRRFRSAGRFRARARRAGFRSGTAAVRVVRARSPRFTG